MTRGIDAEAVRALIADHLAVSADAVRDDAQFETDLRADSLDLVQLAMRLEEEFDISIGEDEGESCQTVRDALDLVLQKMVRPRAA